MTIRPEFQYKPDYEETAISRLNPRRNGPKWQALMRAAAWGGQLIEDLTWDFAVSAMLENANGILLTHAASKVGERRGDLNDVELKRFIAARIQINLCNGSPNEMIKILRTLTNPIQIRYYEGSAGFAIVVWRDAFMREAYRLRVREAMELCRPAGFKMHLIEALAPDAAFTYQDGPGYDVGQYSRII